MCGKQPKAAHVYLFSKIDATLNSKTFKRTKILKNKTHTQDSQSPWVGPLCQIFFPEHHHLHIDIVSDKYNK
jgi:hypothetical protein